MYLNFVSYLTNISTLIYSMVLDMTGFKMVGVIDQYGSVLLFTGTFCITYALLRKVRGATDKQKSINLPPSLPSLPFVGSVFHLPSFSQFHRGLLEWKKMKGGVLAFYLGPKFVANTYFTFIGA